MTSVKNYIEVQVKRLFNFRALNPYAPTPFSDRENIFVTVVSLIGLLRLLIYSGRRRGDLFLFLVSIIYFGWWWQSAMRIRQLITILPILSVSASQLFRLDLNEFISGKIDKRSLSVIPKFLKFFVLFALLLYPPIVVAFSATGSKEFYRVSRETGTYRALYGKGRLGRSKEWFQNNTQQRLLEQRWGSVTESWTFINNQLPPAAVILSDDSRIYYIDRCVIWYQNAGINKIHLHNSLPPIFDMLKSYNVSHIFYSNRVLKHPQLNESCLWRSLHEQEFFELIYSNEKSRVKIYEIKWENIS
jgi:hypothetical protein